MVQNAVSGRVALNQGSEKLRITCGRAMYLAQSVEHRDRPRTGRDNTRSCIRVQRDRAVAILQIVGFDPGVDFANTVANRRDRPVTDLR